MDSSQYVMNIIGDQLNEVRTKHEQDIEKSRQDRYNNQFMNFLLMKTYSHSLSDQNDILLNLKYKVDLASSFNQINGGLMRDYQNTPSLDGLTPSQAVRDLSKMFAGCKTRADFDFRAVSIYQDDENKKTADVLRQNVIAWYEQLYALHDLYDKIVSGLVRNFKDSPGRGRAAHAFKLMTALDRANWVVSMKMSIDEWYISGKAEVYDWLEEELDDNLDDEFRC